MEVTLIKTLTGYVPADEPSRQWDAKNKTGQVVHADFKKIRNYEFHKKWFALLQIGFENWEPPPTDTKWGTPEKNFDRFRKDVTILAGFYDLVHRLDGSFRIQAKSVSFAKMTAKEFQELYSKTIDVLIKHVYQQSLSADELNNIVNKYLEFA